MCVSECVYDTTEITEIVGCVCVCMCVCLCVCVLYACVCV